MSIKQTMLRKVLKSQLAADIKEKTGAHSVIIIVCDSVQPCPDMLAEGECNDSHQFDFVVDGYSHKGAVGHMFQEVWERIDEDAKEVKKSTHIGD